jgi:hypothetical protein
MRASLLSAVLYGLAWLLLAALLQRPLLAAGLAFGGVLAVRVVSGAKERALREPLLFSDYGLFSQAFRHPRLYLPYLQPLPVVLAALVFGAVVGTSLVLEEPGIDWRAWAGLLAAALLLLWIGSAFGAISLQPARDVARYGLLGSHLLYWLAEREPLPPVPAIVFPAVAASRPDIVVVECESFFDARRMGEPVPRDVLRHFDALCREGLSGSLTVPAWGANTMRTEFAFLSGIAPQRLGVHRFNPYRRYARRPVPTLASRLRDSGYRTVCVHPYPAAFFARDRVFPQLGFDAFVDIAHFAGAERAGPYVADAAVLRKVGEKLADAAPSFVFAITMENHGPQHLEAGPGGDELAVYLRHLRNADAMIGALAGLLRARQRDAVLCVYGDHVPSLPSAYARTGYDDPRTDFLVWRRGAAARRADLKVEDLAAQVLDEAHALAP